MNSNILVIYDNNYADEFDVEGFQIWDRIEWAEHLRKVKENVFVPLKKKQEIKRQNALDKHIAKTGSSDNFYYNSYDCKEVYFGTNECVSYDSFEDYEKAFKVVEITFEEENVLKKLFSNEHISACSFGKFLDLSFEFEENI